MPNEPLLFLSHSGVDAAVEVARAQQKIAARCRELGIPKRFAPTLKLHWIHKGYDNQVKCRQHELRGMAKSRIEAIEQKAITEIEMSCLQAQTELAVAGLTSEAARGFLERLPGIETLMPKLSYSEVAGEAEPPVIEQLLSPNALRQRRYRERKALRSVTPNVTPDDDDDDPYDDEPAA